MSVRPPHPRPKGSSASSTVRNVLIAVAVLIFLLARGGAQLLTDFWWYQEIGNGPFFVKSIEFRLLIFFGTFVLLFLPSFFTILISRKFAPMRIRVLEGNIVEFPEHLIRPYLFPLLYAAAGLISLLGSLQASSNWPLILPLFSHPAFNLTDPVFGHDVQFYAFILPLLELAYQIAMTSLLMAAALAFVSYGIQKVLTLGQTGLRMAPVATVHLSILLGALALVKGFGYWIGIYDLLIGQDGVVVGVGYADYHALLPLLRIITGVAFLTALLFIANIKIQNWKMMLGMCAAWGILSFALVAYPKIIQQFQVVPSELDKEREYISRMIAYTRKAYDLENVQAVEVHPSNTLSADDAQSHAATLKNIRLWDRAPLLQSLAQLQEIRPYYKFVSADVDRYQIGGELREVMLSARELDYGNLQNPTWANEHLIFTHGYGFVATPVNQVTSEGLPDFFVKNIPPSGVPELSVKQPALYYGESGNDYAIVNTHQEEFDYPYGNENKYDHYSGTGGVALSSFWRQLVCAYTFSYKIFFSSDIDRSSKILYYRRVPERLRKAFPLLIYDQDPYPVIDRGRIYWICDAYTVNDHFPYAEPIDFGGNIYNYIRNPVKVVVDAYNGTMTYYISDPSDPIVRMYQAIFPGFFHPISEMPEGLRRHIRVPEDYFMAQASIFALYHMTDPDVFYNREDLWQFPRSGEEQEIKPYYVVMQLPGNPNPEFLLMLPFTPDKKDNLAAWFAARCDEPSYGQRLVFSFSKEKLVYGPSQIQARINQDPKFSQLRTLWGQQGSRINVGHLQVIPIGNTMLYVEPLYLQSEQRALPELKLVLLSYGNRIVMADNLDEAFASMFGGEGTAKSAPPKPAAQGTAAPAAPAASSAGLIREALDHYGKAMNDQRNGDWAGYGKEIKALGNTLQSLTGKK